MRRTFAALVVGLMLGFARGWVRGLMWGARNPVPRVPSGWGGIAGTLNAARAGKVGKESPPRQWEAVYAHTSKGKLWTVEKPSDTPHMVGECVPLTFEGPRGESEARRLADFLNGPPGPLERALRGWPR